MKTVCLMFACIAQSLAAGDVTGYRFFGDKIAKAPPFATDTNGWRYFSDSRVNWTEFETHGVVVTDRGTACRVKNVPEYYKAKTDTGIFIGWAKYEGAVKHENLWGESKTYLSYDCGASPETRLRVVNGEVMLVPFRYATNGWGKCSGEVTQRLADGAALITDARYGTVSLYRLRHVPNWSSLLDNDSISVWARDDGMYEYTSVLGANKRIRSYDCGTVPSATQIETFLLPLIKAQDESTRSADELSAAKMQRETELRQQTTATGIARVIRFQQQQASNGYSSFQIELGKRYMRGDGVETNLSLARHWLQSACTNGESEATNLLRRMELQAAPK